jgi:hypothetical protein
MTNTIRTLDDLAFVAADDSWVWKDDMITFPDTDHPICGEFPHDSIVAPRGWDKVD